MCFLVFWRGKILRCKSLTILLPFLWGVLCRCTVQNGEYHTEYNGTHMDHCTLYDKIVSGHSVETGWMNIYRGWVDLDMWKLDALSYMGAELLGILKIRRNNVHICGGQWIGIYGRKLYGPNHADNLIRRNNVHICEYMEYMEYKWSINGLCILALSRDWSDWFRGDILLKHSTDTHFCAGFEQIIPR